jgi:hypothetical protein
MLARKNQSSRKEKINEGTAQLLKVVCKNVATDTAARKCRNLAGLKKEAQKREEPKV